MPGIHETPTSYRTFVEQAAAPANPGATHARLYVGTDGIMRWKDSTGKVHASNSLEPVDYGATSRTLDATDFYRLVRFTNAGAVTVTFPTDAGAGGSVGTVVWVHAAGAAGVTVVGATGVTINGPTFVAEGETLQYVEVAADTWQAVEQPAVTSADRSITNIVQVTQAEYNALAPADPTTLYVVVG